MIKKTIYIITTVNDKNINIYQGTKTSLMDALNFVEKNGSDELPIFICHDNKTSFTGPTPYVKIIKEVVVFKDIKEFVAEDMTKI